MILHTKKSGIITGWPPCKNYDNVVVRRPLSVLNQFKEYIETPHMYLHSRAIVRISELLVQILGYAPKD